MKIVRYFIWSLVCVTSLSFTAENDPALALGSSGSSYTSGYGSVPSQKGARGPAAVVPVIQQLPPGVIIPPADAAHTLSTADLLRIIQDSQQGVTVPDRLAQLRDFERRARSLHLRATRAPLPTAPATQPAAPATVAQTQPADTVQSLFTELLTLFSTAATNGDTAALQAKRKTTIVSLLALVGTPLISAAVGLGVHFLNGQCKTS
jgi:hypothetical protein